MFIFGLVYTGAFCHRFQSFACPILENMYIREEVNDRILFLVQIISICSSKFEKMKHL